MHIYADTIVKIERLLSVCGIDDEIRKGMKVIWSIRFSGDDTRKHDYQNRAFEMFADEREALIRILRRVQKAHSDANYCGEVHNCIEELKGDDFKYF